MLNRGFGQILYVSSIPALNDSSALTTPPAKPACTGLMHHVAARNAEEVADLAVATLRNGYLTNKVFTLDGGLLPA